MSGTGTNAGRDMAGDLRRLARRVLLMVGRGRVTLADDTGPVQSLQVRLGKDELQNDIARLQEFGFASLPPVGTEVALIFVAGDRANPIIVASNNQQLRLKDLAEGDAAIYDGQGKSIWLKKDGGIVIAAGSQAVTVSNAASVTVESSGEVSVTSGGAVTINGDTAAVATSGDASLSAGGDLTLAGDAVAIGASGKASLSSGSQASIEAPMVQLGSGGNIGTMPAPAVTLFNSFTSSGPSAALSNPVSPSLANLHSSLTGSTITTGLAGLVAGGSITPTDQTNIIAALTGPSGLLPANNALQAHTDRLAGLQPTIDGTQPTLGSTIGAADGLDYTAGGRFGTSATALPAMTTGLGAASSVTAANSYINTIVAVLTADPTQVATIIATIGTHTTTLNGFVTADTGHFATAQSNITVAGNFLGLAGLAKNNGAAVQALVAQVASAGTIATLRTV